MISLSEVANEIYNQSLSPQEEKIFLDAIWTENQEYLRKIFNDKISFRKHIVMEKIKIEEGDDFNLYIGQIYNKKYMDNFSAAYSNKYQDIETEIIKIVNKLRNRHNKRTSIKLRTLMKNCGYKRRSNEFNQALKQITEKHNVRILYDNKLEFKIEDINIDKRITIILIH